MGTFIQQTRHGEDDGTQGLWIPPAEPSNCQAPTNLWGAGFWRFFKWLRLSLLLFDGFQSSFDVPIALKCQELASMVIPGGWRTDFRVVWSRLNKESRVNCKGTE
ncbi:hypothetical protein E3N88_28847 [Mikania micrantha]|uniref:Uncharacterized protein n=1 Tax=Mikania micrantha TaxID=192012 RepID=A0A5N6N1M4_9ASTR|nr:hypothetical protein E3N88_28847 [Mikania micrantha]